MCGCCVACCGLKVTAEYKKQKAFFGGEKSLRTGRRAAEPADPRRARGKHGAAAGFPPVRRQQAPSVSNRLLAAGGGEQITAQ